METDKNTYLLLQLDYEELQEILKLDPSDIQMDLESLDSDDR